MENLKKIGQQALADNKHLKEVFVTTDEIAFVDRNSAINHVVKLDNKEVLKVEREGEKQEVKKDDTPKPPKAEELIALITALKTDEEYNTFELPEGEKRATVIKALADKKAELGIV
jgi:hypothetical protein